MRGLSKQVTSRGVSRTTLASVLTSTQNLLVNPSKKTSKSRASTKQKGPAAKQRGAQMLKDAGLDFNKDYQKAHVRAKHSYEGQGHWQKFLEAIASDKAVKCPTCQSLRDQVLARGSTPLPLILIVDPRL